LEFTSNLNLSVVEDDMVIAQGSAESDNPSLLEEVKEETPRLYENLIMTNATEDGIYLVDEESFEVFRREFTFSEDICEDTSGTEDDA
jgi:hypothetical protein